MNLRKNNTLVITLLGLPDGSCDFAVTRDGLIVRDLIMKKTAPSSIKSIHMAAERAEFCLALGIWIMCKLQA